MIRGDRSILKNLEKANRLWAFLRLRPKGTSFSAFHVEHPRLVDASLQCISGCEVWPARIQRVVSGSMSRGHKDFQRQHEKDGGLVHRGQTKWAKSAKAHVFWYNQSTTPSKCLQKEIRSLLRHRQIAHTRRRFRSFQANRAETEYLDKKIDHSLILGTVAVASDLACRHLPSHVGQPGANQLT